MACAGVAHLVAVLGDALVLGCASLGLYRALARTCRFAGFGGRSFVLRRGGVGGGFLCGCGLICRLCGGLDRQSEKRESCHCGQDLVHWLLLHAKCRDPLKTAKFQLSCTPRHFIFCMNEYSSLHGKSRTRMVSR